MGDTLVIRRGGLGDTLLMLPVLRALKRRHPDAELHFAGALEFAAVLCDYGAVDAVRSSEDLQLWTLGVAGRDEARDMFGRYERVIADDPITARAGGATKVQVFDAAPATHEPLGLQLVRRLGLTARWPEDAWLAPPPGGSPSGPVMLAPGSGGRAKCWPKENWLALADVLAGGLAATKREVAVVVGPVEIERDDPRSWPWPAGTLHVLEPEVTVLARRLAGASVFVGNDSGTTHLAAMLAVPTVALFGPTDPRVWAPVGPMVRNLRRGATMSELPLAAVRSAVHDLLP